MKKLILIVTLISGITAQGAQTNAFPILRGKLQGDLDGAGYAATNLNDIKFTDGRSFTNWAATNVAGVSPSELASATNSATLATQLELTGRTNTAALAVNLGGTFQPLDSDLTAVAALSTTAYGRALLTLANQAALAALFPSDPLTNGYTANVILAGSSNYFGGKLNVGGILLDGGNNQISVGQSVLGNGYLRFNGDTYLERSAALWMRIGNGSTTNGSLAVSNLTVVGSLNLKAGGGTIGTENGSGSITLNNQVQSKNLVAINSTYGITGFGYEAIQGPISSTNVNVANTYATFDGSRTTAGAWLEYTTNGVSKFSVNTVGAVGSTAVNVHSSGTTVAQISANSGGQFNVSRGGGLLADDGASLGGNLNSSILSGSTAATVGNWTLKTNLLIPYGAIRFGQLTVLPTNAILASSANNTPWTAFSLTNLGPVLAKTNSTSAAGGFTVHPIAVNSEYLAQLREEFFGGGNSSFQIGELGWRNISGGNGTPGAIASEANHPGIFRASTAGSANSYSGFALSQSTSQSGFILTDGDGAWTFIFRPSSTNNTDIAVGFAPPATHFIATASPNTLAWNTANICVVSTNGSPWYLHARNAAGGPESWASTGVASQSAGWVKAKFRWDAANSIMYLSVNDSAEVSASGASLPSLSALRSPVFQIITSDTNARDIDADFFWAKQAVTR